MTDFPCTWDDYLTGELLRQKSKNLERNFHTRGPGGVTFQLDGRPVVSFAGNDYLGLSNHPQVREAAIRATEKYGSGSGSSRHITGTVDLYDTLEAALAKWKGSPGAIIFSSGYLANLGLLAALCGPGDLLIFDHSNHASLIDGARLSGATLARYPHLDLVAMKRLLERPARRRLIVTDGLFSMDGDLADLNEICPAAEQSGAWVMVDDAHGGGVLGPQGAGTAAHLGMEARIPIQVGTLSKALGSLGGFITGSRALIDFIRNRSRSLMYTTALPPAALAAAHRALELVVSDPTLRNRVLLLADEVRSTLRQADFRVPGGPGPIVPVLIGSPGQALELQGRLLERGIFVPAIRPPTVAPGSSRLRITLSALHSEEQVAGLLEVLLTASPGAGAKTN